MNITSLLNISADLLKIILKSSQPADRIVNEFIRAKRFLGSNDRKFVTELIFASLRNLLLIDFLYSKLNGNITEKNLGIIITTSLLSLKTNLINSVNLNDILSNFPNSNTNYYELIINLSTTKNIFTSDIINNFIDNVISEYDILKTKATNGDIESQSKFYSIPEMLLNKMYANDLIELHNLLENSLLSAPMFLRVNVSKTNLSTLTNFLDSQNIIFSKSQLSPSSIQINKRIKIDDNPLYKSGMFEIQDDGSQLISYSLGAESNSRILDSCAGAGGKSLHLADITGDSAEIYSTDVEFGRLKELIKRANRSNFKSINVRHLKSQEFNEIKKALDYKMFDFILVDAPCSGTGTIRRDPIRKYNITESLIQRLAQKQLRILSQYSRFLKVGGVIVYSTCSILPDENTEVVNNFLKENKNFQPAPLLEAFEKYEIKIDTLNSEDWYLNIAFDKYYSDGFFMARMKRIY